MFHGGIRNLIVRGKRPSFGHPGSSGQDQGGDRAQPMDFLLDASTKALAALAMVKRVYDLHVLSKIIATQGDLILSYLPEFVVVPNPVPGGFWLCSLSLFTAQVDKEGLLCPIQAHYIQGFAISLLHWKNRSVPSMLEAPSWKTHSVFVDYYLRDIQREEGDVFALGPVLTAGDLVA
ncbi:hypothetical protein E2C01_041493 [Portunus trituberculatus]|uniref:Uncharacterized protein n=1 Tax=Portunus trituberculatus TaxID=210409 RepID=A0A5B7FQV8_PORTR|nr:hypothetical protein [Portunus trituberculatus]